MAEQAKKVEAQRLSFQNLQKAEQYLGRYNIDETLKKKAEVYARIGEAYAKLAQSYNS